MGRDVKFFVIGSGIVVLICIALVVAAIGNNQKLNMEMLDFKSRLFTLEKENNLLKQDNTALNRRLIEATEMVEDLSKQKYEISKKLSDCKDDLSKAFTIIGKLEEKIKGKDNDIAGLKQENSVLKVHVEEAGRVAESKKENENNIEIVKMEKEAGLGNLKPKDFVVDFNGTEAFLQNCSALLCRKITLNIEGVKYAKTGDFNKAEEAFKEAIKIDSGYRPAKLNLGLVYDNTKTKKEALDYWVGILK